jgi:hypothetical protein
MAWRSVGGAGAADSTGVAVGGGGAGNGSGAVPGADTDSFTAGAGLTGGVPTGATKGSRREMSSAGAEERSTAPSLDGVPPRGAIGDRTVGGAVLTAEGGGRRAAGGAGGSGRGSRGDVATDRAGAGARSDPRVPPT